MEGLYNDLINNSSSILKAGLTIILILIAGKLLIKSGDILINRIFMYKKSKGKELEPREVTLSNLMQSGIRYVTYFIVIITILERLGVPVLALLSTAGVLGVGIAFGAQSLFKDIITGFFILMENQYSVGDYISTQGVDGIVDQLSLRCTYLRDFSGQLHIIPNGNISLVTNHTRGNRRALVEVRVAYESNMQQVLEVLNQVCAEVKQELNSVLKEDPKVWGIVNLDESAFIVRIIAQTEAMQQWNVELALRKKIVEAINREGLKIPYPQREVFMNQERVKYDTL